VDQVQVPEPGTLALLGAALFSLAALRRRNALR
ncbi:MAG TPA: PEP-CTERM sorting domain-containing protein, partial [Casimicrobiaceae bacterium]